MRKILILVIVLILLFSIYFYNFLNGITGLVILGHENPDFFINTTSAFDAGQKNNISTETDRYNISSNVLELDFPYAEKHDNLTGYWRFENNYNDELGLNDGSCTNCPTYNSTSYFDGGFEFNGSNEYITIGSSSLLKPDNWTLVMYARFRPHETPGSSISPTVSWNVTNQYYPSALLKFGGLGGGAPLLYMNANNYRYFSANPVNVSDGNWHFVAFVMPNNEAAGILSSKMYGDAQELDTGTTQSTDIPAAKQDFVIAQARTNYYNGTLDEIKLYNKSLTQSEITALYNSGNKYKSTGNWTSDNITITTGYKLLNTTINFTTNTYHNISKVEWLSDGIVKATNDTDITSSGLVNYTNDTLTSGTFDYINYTENMTIRIYLEGNGTSTPKIYDIIGYYNISATAPPNIVLNSPDNETYYNNETGVHPVDFNFTATDDVNTTINCSIYLDDSLNQTNDSVQNNTPSIFAINVDGYGNHSWYVNCTDGVLSNVSETRMITLINLSITCEAGGPYQQGALVLVQGNVTNNQFLPNQPVDLYIYDSDDVLTASSSMNTTQNGTYQEIFSSLAQEPYTLNASTTYQGFNKNCTDTFQVGSAGSLLMEKIAHVNETYDYNVTYNITLRLTNRGGANITTSNITDSDSTSSPYDEETIIPGETKTESYLKNYTREDTSRNVTLAIATGQGFDTYFDSYLSEDSLELIITIPGYDEEEELTLVKNIYYNSENSTHVNYTITDQTVNSGGVDLTGIVFQDSDLGLSGGSALIFDLNKTASNTTSGTILVAKSADNTEKLFVKATATWGVITWESNQINIIVPGYGGPADLSVDAPASVSASTTMTSTINITNQNPDIGQDFVIDYWITSNDESVNYSSGQKTIYVAASSSNITTASLISPSSAGTYRFKTFTSWVGGTASAYDSFTVSVAGVTGPAGGTGGVAEEEEEEEEEEIIIPEIPTEKEDLDEFILAIESKIELIRGILIEYNLTDELRELEEIEQKFENAKEYLNQNKIEDAKELLSEVSLSLLVLENKIKEKGIEIKEIEELKIPIEIIILIVFATFVISYALRKKKSRKRKKKR